MVGTVFLGHGQLLVRAGGRDDRRTHGFADIDAGEADTAGRPVHQQHFTRLHVDALVRQRHGAGRVSDGEAGGRDVIHAFRHRHNARFLDDGFFRVTTAMQIGHYPVARLELGDGVAHLDHFAGAFQAGREGDLGLVLIGARDHQDIGEIAARCMDRDADLTGSGCRLGNVLVQLQDIEFTQIVDADRAHGVLLGF